MAIGWHLATYAGQRLVVLMQRRPPTMSPRPSCRTAGSELVKMAIEEMARDGCEEVVLEAEVVNTGALKLYQALGFVRDKRLHRYYLNGTDAYRLKLVLPGKEELEEAAGLLQLPHGNNLDAAATTELQPVAAA